MNQVSVSSAQNFGSAIALSGDTLLVGAHSTSNGLGAVYVGSPYVFVRQSDGSWSLEATLTASDSDASSNYLYFGRTVALAENTAVVGATGHGSNCGAAYVYTRDEVTNVWTESAKLVPDNCVSNHYFGSTLDVEKSFSR